MPRKSRNSSGSFNWETTLFWMGKILVKVNEGINE